MARSDLARPQCQAILTELFALMRRMNTAGVSYSSWYGRFDAWPSIWEHINRGADYEPWPDNPDELRVPWFLLWEIAWLVANTPIRRGARVLDMGGAGSLFSCYLASRGCEVHTIDIDAGLCAVADRQASAMNWRLIPQCMDMTRLTYPDAHFDHIFSVCVFEHLPVSGRIACNGELRRILKPGGTTGFSFDYANPQSFGRIDTPADVHRQFAEPSGLSIRGNPDFVDTGDRYLETPSTYGLGRFTRAAASVHAALRGDVVPSRALRGDTRYTFGALFLERAHR